MRGRFFRAIGTADPFILVVPATAEALVTLHTCLSAVSSDVWQMQELHINPERNHFYSRHCIISNCRPELGLWPPLVLLPLEALPYKKYIVQTNKRRRAGPFF